MENDFYLDRHWLAGYFEKDWFDKVRADNMEPSRFFEFPAFDPAILYSPYHEQFIDFLALTVRKVDASPTQMLEVGSSLGRTYYEVCNKLKSVKKATLLEPSQNLVRTFTQIFETIGGPSFPVLTGNRDLSEIKFDTSKIRAACANVEYNLINLPYETADLEIASHDLVLCSNVIDQCHEPEALISFLKNQTKDHGLLALSCTYQWNDKYIKNSSKPITNINELFGEEWQLLGETNIEFKCRKVERHWVTFLSHVSILQKSTID